jgi:hypothetical protein
MASLRQKESVWIEGCPVPHTNDSGFWMRLPAGEASVDGDRPDDSGRTLIRARAERVQTGD